MTPQRQTARLAATPVARLVLYGLVLLALLGGGAAAGAVVGPEPASRDDATPATDGEGAGSHETGTGFPPSADVPGVTVARDGYRLELEEAVRPAGATDAFRFTIVGAEGRPLRSYEEEHDEDLHLVVAGRNLSDYAHVHPRRDDDGQWSVELPALPAGSYRTFADFVPGGADEGITLGHDLTVTGSEQADPSIPVPSADASVAGYDVAFEGELVPGEESEVTVTVTRDGEAVEDLRPYLGALGHLVALRNGDLAYLHVHPLDETDGPGGPSVRFAVEVPTTGTYGLFFDFSHDGEVRNASVVSAAGSAPGRTDGGDTTHLGG